MHKHEQTLPDLVDAFTVAVTRYGEFILKDSQIANRHYDEFTTALKQIATHGEEGLNLLTSLLDDDRIRVRATAAPYLLNFCPDRAMKVLEETARLEDRAIAMLAIVALKKWEKGIYLDPATGRETVKH